MHDGSPPQTSAVHVNGASAVLLTIMKSGASSTLDIINGVKALLPSVSHTLPGSLKLMAVGDQSVFVTDAVSSVVREGIIAAALTGAIELMRLIMFRPPGYVASERVTCRLRFAADRHGRSAYFRRWPVPPA
ncbi:multidrug efflux pump subunit AcrB [Bradyrhizobium sp. GM7.3]